MRPVLGLLAQGGPKALAGVRGVVQLLLSATTLSGDLFDNVPSEELLPVGYIALFIVVGFILCNRRALFEQCNRPVL